MGHVTLRDTKTSRNKQDKQDSTPGADQKKTKRTLARTLGMQNNQMQTSGVRQRIEDINTYKVVSDIAV
eukprot:4757210-Amphidinium_carterae.1